MKYVYVPLYARNVYFPPRTENKLEQLTQLAENNNVKKWIQSNFRNWIINKADLPLFPEAMLNGKNVPQWVKTKYGKEDIYLANDLAVTTINKVRLREIIQYLNSLKHNVSHMSVPEAVKQTLQWLKEQDYKESEQSKEIDTKDIQEIHVYSDGFRWVENFGKLSLIREGELMQNCLRKKKDGWFERVSAKEIKIFSLRDSRNQPHITVQYDINSRKISQIKGKQNGPVIDKYLPYLVDFLQKNYIQYKTVNEEDLNLQGYTFSNGKLYKLLAE